MGLVVKPCPFCGFVGTLCFIRESENCFIYCCHCEARGPLGTKKKETYEKWNKRKTNLTARVMALETALAEIDPFLAHRAKQFVIENTKVLVEHIAKEPTS